MKALITGASSGIGRDMAFKLSSMGYDLILVSRNTEELKNIKNTLKTKVEVVSLDLTDVDNVSKLYKKYKSANIDVLVSNAGFGDFGRFHESDVDKSLDMIDLNVKAYHLLTRLFLEDFVKRDSGYILNVASLAGFMSGPMMATYYATKNYVLSLSEAIYEELRRDKSNVSISVLCPGPVNTNFNIVAGNIKFKSRALSSFYVATYAIDKMFKGKFYIIPGTACKVMAVFSRFIPRKLLLRIVYSVAKKKEL